MENKTANIITKGEYNFLGNLGDEVDVLDSFVNDYNGSSAYIGDAISEIADSQVPIYTYDIWEGAKEIREYITEAQEQGLCEGVTDIDKLMQMGYYQFYTQTLYDNLDTMVFNIMVDKMNEFLSDGELPPLDIDAIVLELESKSENYDNNKHFSDIDDEVNEIIEEIKDGQYVIES